MPHHAVENDVPESHRRRERLMWGAWAITLVVAALMYADKASEERSAFVRWRHQIHEFWQGANIWETYHFPNPPIMPIGLSPFMALPPVIGAVSWFAVKAIMATCCLVWCFRIARGTTGPRWTWWAQFLVILLSLRPILSDLHHGNINILILFLVVTTLMAWRRGFDVAAGLLLSLSIAVKVTPALFVPYLIYKRSWRAAGATFLGLALFLVIVPSAVIGPSFNGQCLAMWCQRMLAPFVVEGDISPQEVNQSLGGVATRLMTDVPIRPDDQRYGGTKYAVNLVSWPQEDVTRLVKGLCIGLVGVLAYLCRTRATSRLDGRLLGEFSLVVLTMLFASERTWKHHYVTLLLPYTYVVYRTCVLPGPKRIRRALALSLTLSAFLIATTSSDLGDLFADESGAEIALAYGMFFWGAVVLYLATAWRVNAERNLVSELSAEVTASVTIPSPHVGLSSRATSPNPSLPIIS